MRSSKVKAPSLLASTILYEDVGKFRAVNFKHILEDVSHFYRLKNQVLVIIIVIEDRFQLIDDDSGESLDP
jgi:hypothetical protein